MAPAGRLPWLKRAGQHLLFESTRPPQGFFSWSCKNCAACMMPACIASPRKKTFVRPWKTRGLSFAVESHEFERCTYFGVLGFVLNDHADLNPAACLTREEVGNAS